MEEFAGKYLRRVIHEVHAGLPFDIHGNTSALPNISEVHKHNNLIAIRFKFDNIQLLVDRLQAIHSEGYLKGKVLHDFQNYCMTWHYMPKGCALVRGKENTLLFGCVVKQTMDPKAIMAQIAEAAWFNEIPQVSSSSGEAFAFEFGADFEQWYEQASAKILKSRANMGGPNDRCFQI